MFGIKKKQQNNEPQKKKAWELEMEENEEDVPASIEIPKDIYKEDEQEDANIDQNKDELIQETENEPNNQNDVKQKAFDWMTSEDEAIEEEVKETEEIVASKEEKPEERQQEAEENDVDSRTIFVSKIPMTASDEEILSKFRVYGNILNVEIPRNEGARFNKGRAFIEYSTVEEAKSVTEETQFIGSNQLSVTIGMNAATQALAIAEKENPFIYDEKTKRYIRASEIEMRKKAEEEESDSSDSDSDSESGDGSQSGSGSEGGSDSDGGERIIRKKPSRGDERSRSRSRSKSPQRPANRIVKKK